MTDLERLLQIVKKNGMGHIILMPAETWGIFCRAIDGMNRTLGYAFGDTPEQAIREVLEVIDHD